MKIALVHDWLTGMRGGEKVLAEFIRLLPDADVFTLVWKRGNVTAEIEKRVHGVSLLDKLPLARQAYRYYLPLFPIAARSLDLSGYDLVISSSHAVAKGVCVPAGATHISYIHTPMRYVWDNREDYFRFGSGRLWKRAALAIVAPYLRRFDRRTALSVDWFLANSETVHARISSIYGAGATVVYPPVDTDFFTPSSDLRPAGDYYLVVSSLEPYKRIDLAVDAFSGGPRRLLVAGKGTLGKDLHTRARPPVEFLGEVSDERLRDLYRNCRALVFPGREDFGMVPVEAQACGRPVVCFGEGGATETVVDGCTGVHFRPQTAGSLLAAVEKLEAMEWDSRAIRQQSLSFSRHRFRDSINAFFRAHVPFALSSNEHCYRDLLSADL